MMPTRHRLTTALVLVSLAAGALVATGCSRTGQYRSKPSPGVFSTSMTRDEAANNWHYMVNSNIRAFIDDWGRFTLINRPSRVMPTPTAF